MELSDKYFLAVYTNEVKDYAVEKFFKELGQFKHGGVVDNSANKDYHHKLEKYTTLPVYHLDIPYQPRKTLFQRNVAESVSYLRDKFLEGTCEYFLILESDVIVGPDFIDKIDDTIGKIPLWHEGTFHGPWGALGALYYEGFHDYTKSGLQPTHHVLSGATIYRRAAVEEFPFRWSMDNLGAFPDAWWSMDASKKYSLWNDHDIKLEHLHNNNGTRYSKNL